MDTEEELILEDRTVESLLKHTINEKEKDLLAEVDMRKFKGSKDIEGFDYYVNGKKVTHDEFFMSVLSIPSDSDSKLELVIDTNLEARKYGTKTIWRRLGDLDTSTYTSSYFDIIDNIQIESFEGDGYYSLRNKNIPLNIYRDIVEKDKILDLYGGSILDYSIVHIKNNSNSELYTENTGLEVYNEFSNSHVFGRNPINPEIQYFIPDKKEPKRLNLVPIYIEVEDDEKVIIPNMLWTSHADLIRSYHNVYLNGDKSDSISLSGLPSKICKVIMNNHRYENFTEEGQPVEHIRELVDEKTGKFYMTLDENTYDLSNGRELVRVYTEGERYDLSNAIKQNDYQMSPKIDGMIKRVKVKINTVFKEREV